VIVANALIFVRYIAACLSARSDRKLKVTDK
jgi:hypothetical protein